MIRIEVNGQEHELDVPESTPLLWVLREELKLTGTKFGCGRGICGACTIHLNGQPTRTCILPCIAAQGQKIKTIEGFGTQELHPVQKAWTDMSVPQCGYCQSGQIMQAIGWLESQPGPVTQEQLWDAMASNLCRCGTYNKIRSAIVKAAKDMGKLQ